MEINEIRIKSEGYVFCKSSFYSVCDILTNQEFCLNRGINILSGEIDSGVFGISYMLSMYDKIDLKNNFFTTEIFVNGTSMALSELTKYSCYLDQSYCMFSSKKPVNKLVMQALVKSGISYSPNEICNMFQISDFRFERPIDATGNERFKAMAAIAFSNGKQVFCFPWLSKMRYNSFNKHMISLMDTLTSQGKIVVLPIGEN